MNLISILLLLPQLIQIHSQIISHTFTFYENYEIYDKNLLNHTLISLYTVTDRLRCASLCNSNNLCLTIMFVNANSAQKCYLLNATITSNQYKTSQNSVVMQKQIDNGVALNGQKQTGNSTYLTWSTNGFNNRTFTRYLITYTTNLWKTSSFATGMFTQIGIDYRFVDVAVAFVGLNSCFGLCLRNTSCYGIVYKTGVCFLKNPIYKTSNSYQNCTQNTSCAAYDLNTTYTNNYIFSANSLVTLYGFMISLYDSSTSMWTSFSNIVYV